MGNPNLSTFFVDKVEGFIEYKRITVKERCRYGLETAAKRTRSREGFLSLCDLWRRYLAGRSQSLIHYLSNPETEQKYNVVQLDGSGLRLPELENQLQFSLLGERKVVMIENLHLLKGKGKENDEEEATGKLPPQEESRWLSQLMQQDHILVLYFYQNIDKRKRFVKQVLTIATSVECPMLKRDDMIRAVQEFFQSYKLKADYALVDALVQISEVNWESPNKKSLNWRWSLPMANPFSYEMPKSIFPLPPSSMSFSSWKESQAENMRQL
jgi:hypothetical protein